MFKRLFIIVIILFVCSDFAISEVIEHATSSVLSKGSWVKIQTEQTGVHLLTNESLAQMGFANLEKVSVWGGRGSQLPFSNSDWRTDDLVQLPTMQTSAGILFFAETTPTWSFSQATASFGAVVHQSSYYNYYFLTDSHSVLALSVKDTPQTTDANYSTYTSRAHHEVNTHNIGSTGRTMYGEELSAKNNSVVIDLGLPTRTAVTDEVKLIVSFVVSSTVACDYSISFNSDEVATGTVSALETRELGKQITRTLTINSNNLTESKLTLKIGLSSTNKAWLDYATAISTTTLDMNNQSQLMFRQVETYNQEGSAAYNLKNCRSDIVIWNVTNPLKPQKVNSQQQGSIVSFADENESGSEYVAFSSSSSSLPQPFYVGKVSNQNLHSQQPVDHIIVTHPDFLSQAERLANLHQSNSGISVAVVTTEQIYNEFSSGKTDVSAIRDFLKMVYDRNPQKLRTALLFGDGSYDNLNTSDGNKIPTYQSAASLDNIQSYVTDDFFGWLNDNEGGNDLSARLDIGIGRFPCKNTDEADVLVDKVETYLTNLESNNWKARIAFVADDDNSNEHLINAENLAQKMENMHPEMNYKRIYLEAYQYDGSSSSTTYPGARTDFADAINNGSLIINYVGHGNSGGLTADGLFRQSDITSWTNKKRLTFFITAACNFAPFDKTDASNSAGEEALMYDNGGFIALFSSTRTVYSNSNYQINNALYDYLLEKNSDGRQYNLGEAIMQAKNKVGGMINSLKYVLLGDPAITIWKNAETVTTDSINGEPLLTCDEPIKALALSRISGSVRKPNGAVDETFNGTVSILFYDKKSTTKTYGTKSDVYSYEEYKNLLYKGTAKVSNGRFTTEFRLSKDIDFSLGYGRIAYYAISTDSIEANGADHDILVGGVDDNIVIDTIGPDITAWIDFDSFKLNQSSTGSAPILYATISDISGINTTGIGIGHDISVCINNDRNNPIILNDYFSYNSGSSTTGTLRYQFSALTDGLKSLTLKAWDTYNNSSETNVNINSRATSAIRFGSTQLYPNPFRATKNELWLSFSHNDGGTILNITVELFSADGRNLISEKMTIIATEIQIEAIDLISSAPEITCLPHGLYVVKVSVNSSSGRSGSFCKRLLITK